MTTNTSATGGYLIAADDPAPLEDEALDDFLQAVVVGISGLAGTVVFPRWQTDVPNLPDAGTDWAAVGVTEQDPDTYAVTSHDPEGADDDGVDQLIRHETIVVKTSFYGPNAGKYMSLFRDGLQVEQNRAALTAAGFGLKQTSKPIRAPELVKGKWLNRIDLDLIVRRMILREYPVLSLLSANGTIYTDQPERETPFEVTQTP